MSKKKIDELQEDTYFDDKLLSHDDKAEKVVTDSNKPENEFTQKQIEKLQEENEKLKASSDRQKQEYDSIVNLAKQIQADFENYRKRNNEAVRFAKDDGIAHAVKAVLPCADAISRATEYTKDEDTIKGLKMVSDKFVSCLASIGVKKFNSINEKFNPEYHSALNSIEQSGTPPGIVINEVESGYMIGDKVLRYALVIISK